MLKLSLQDSISKIAKLSNNSSITYELTKNTTICDCCIILNIFYYVGALVHILKDGSVMLYHGGIEVGQGLNTKVMQICSRALCVPITLIHINDTTTNTIANPSGTGSSVSTDIYGQAVVNGCNILNERLAPVKEANPSDTWEQLVSDLIEIYKYTKVETGST